eukprot:scaffold6267_cov106-Isochrysis_galbana.AAC.2
MLARQRRCSQLPMKPHSAVNEGKRRQTGETRGKKGRTAHGWRDNGRRPETITVGVGSWCR